LTVHGSKLIHSNYIEEQTVKNIVDWLLEHYPKLRIALEISNRLYTNFDIKLMPGWMPPTTQVDFRAFIHQPTAKILFDLREVSDIPKINCQLPNHVSMVITDGGILGQIAHKDVSKLYAIKNLASSFGYGLEEVVAFGDDYNDLEMIRESGLGVAMGNAPQAVKDAANIVTLTNDEDGVACELERILKGQV
jgi:hydroxymethylpyrimidine pyrophosphatase-like HAD family hydrolase